MFGKICQKRTVQHVDKPGVLLRNWIAANPAFVCLVRNIRILSSFICNSLLADGTDTAVNIVLQITSLVDKQVLSLEN